MISVLAAGWVAPANQCAPDAAAVRPATGQSRPQGSNAPRISQQGTARSCRMNAETAGLPPRPSSTGGTGSGIARSGLIAPRSLLGQGFKTGERIREPSPEKLAAMLWTGVLLRCIRALPEPASVRKHDRCTVRPGGALVIGGCAQGSSGVELNPQPGAGRSGDLLKGAR